MRTWAIIAAVAVASILGAASYSRWGAGAVHLHGVVRPDSNGHWFIQNDGTHAAAGIIGIKQMEDRLIIKFDRNYPKAGVIQVTSDDGFGMVVAGRASLGIGAAAIFVYANGRLIDPATVCSYSNCGDGNFWISVTMMR